MSEFLKYLGDSLRRTFGTVVERPMPWNMIDKLASLEEKCEQSKTLDDGHGLARQDSERLGDRTNPARKSEDGRT